MARSSSASAEGGMLLDELHQRYPDPQRYSGWRKKINLVFVCGEVDWVITKPKPAEPEALVRETINIDTEWRKK